MPHRSPARWLAPLALLAALLAVFLLARPASDEGSRGGAGSTGASQTSTAARTTTTKRRSSKARTYTVRRGDVLSTIAERTGVSLQRLQELNPDIDANALRTGQKLKLAPSSQ